MTIFLWIIVACIVLGILAVLGAVYTKFYDKQETLPVIENKIVNPNVNFKKPDVKAMSKYNDGIIKGGKVI